MGEPRTGCTPLQSGVPPGTQPTGGGLSPPLPPPSPGASFFPGVASACESYRGGWGDPTALLPPYNLNFSNTLALGFPLEIWGSYLPGEVGGGWVAEVLGAWKEKKIFEEIKKSLYESGKRSRA